MRGKVALPWMCPKISSSHNLAPTSLCDLHSHSSFSEAPVPVSRGSAPLTCTALHFNNALRSGILTTNQGGEHWHPSISVSPGQNSIFFQGLAQMPPYQRSLALSKLLHLLRFLYSAVEWVAWSLSSWVLGKIKYADVRLGTMLASHKRCGSVNVSNYCVCICCKNVPFCLLAYV